MRNHVKPKKIRTVQAKSIACAVGSIGRGLGGLVEQTRALLLGILGTTRHGVGGLLGGGLLTLWITCQCYRLCNTVLTWLLPG